MLATRAATRLALRSPTLRRGIHSGVRGDWTRTSVGTIGVVLASGAAALGTYVSYKSSGTTQSTLGEKYDKVRQKTPESKLEPAPVGKSSTPKPQAASSVDSPAPTKPSPSEPGVLESTSTPDANAAKSADKPTDPGNPDQPDDMKSLESDAANQGAFNPETGEINWDCPCLGGMAHGPCGPQFREAFSCFVHSEQEPKGVDCVEKFKNMQDCFREHPDVYGEETDDDDEESAAPAPNPDSPEPKADEDQSSSAPKKKADTPTAEKKPEPPTEDKPDAPAGEKPSAPTPPAKKPESRTRAPTANVSPDETPTKSSTKH